jgi:hypothetical protein
MITIEESFGVSQKLLVPGIHALLILFQLEHPNLGTMPLGIASGAIRFPTIVSMAT